MIEGPEGGRSRYVPGPGLDDYAAYTVGTGGSITRSWPMLDPLGSVTAVTDGAGVATQINRYDEYGVPQTGFSGRFGYAGASPDRRAIGRRWPIYIRRTAMPDRVSRRADARRVVARSSPVTVRPSARPRRRAATVASVPPASIRGRA